MSNCGSKLLKRNKKKQIIPWPKPWPWMLDECAPQTAPPSWPLSQNPATAAQHDGRSNVVLFVTNKCARTTQILMFFWMKIQLRDVTDVLLADQQLTSCEKLQFERTMEIHISQMETSFCGAPTFWLWSFGHDVQLSLHCSMFDMQCCVREKPCKRNLAWQHDHSVSRKHFAIRPQIDSSTSVATVAKTMPSMHGLHNHGCIWGTLTPRSDQPSTVGDTMQLQFSSIDMLHCKAFWGCGWTRRCFQDWFGVGTLVVFSCWCCCCVDDQAFCQHGLFATKPCGKQVVVLTKGASFGFNGSIPATLVRHHMVRLVSRQLMVLCLFGFSGSTATWF